MRCWRQMHYLLVKNNALLHTTPTTGTLDCLFVWHRQKEGRYAMKLKGWTTTSTERCEQTMDLCNFVWSKSCCSMIHQQIYATLYGVDCTCLIKVIMVVVQPVTGIWLGEIMGVSSLEMTRDNTELQYHFIARTHTFEATNNASSYIRCIWHIIYTRGLKT